MKYSKQINVLGLGLLLSLMVSTTSHAAATDNLLSEQVTDSLQDSTGIDESLLQKQEEIDNYVFETHANEITEKGFVVTHTSQAEEYVEIGIQPFTQESADYIYELFGKDQVIVVEGLEPVTLEFGTDSETTNDEIFQTAVVDSEEIMEVDIISTTSEPIETNSLSTSLILTVGLGVVIILSIIARKIVSRN